MHGSPATDSLIVQLEIRQDEALRQLVELEQRIEDALRAALPAVAPRGATGETGRTTAAETSPAPVPWAA